MYWWEDPAFGGERQSMGTYVSHCLEPLESRLLMAVIPVLNNDNSGAGSLRDAIAAAAAGDTIDLTALSGTITLSSQLTVSKNLTFAGPGRDRLALSGNGMTRVMSIEDGVSVHISDLTIERGRHSSGAGVYSLGDIVLDRVAFRGNVALQSSGFRGTGGALYVAGGNLTATDTEFTDNAAGHGGGALHFSEGNLSLLRSTFARNRVGGFGGDMSSVGGAITLFGTLHGSIVNSTISGNAAF